MSGLTNEDFKALTCALCKLPFRTYPKPGQQGLPHEVPYVDGGLVSFADDDGSERPYHGYTHQPESCWGKASRELLGG